MSKPVSRLATDVAFPITSPTKLYEMQRQFKGGNMPEELRAISLEIYLVDFNQQLDKALLELQKILADAVDTHPECHEEIGMMSAELKSIFDDVEAERHTIEQFSKKFPT